MKVECIHCGASGQIDETKIPAGAKSLKCPRCKESFPLPTIAAVDTQAAVEAAPPLASSPLQPPSMPRTDAPPPLSAVEPESPDTAAPPLQATPAAMTDCSVCSDQFPKTEMVRFGTAWVCATCKPKYVQMLAQGAQRPGEMRYAGFRIRFGAKFLDGLILWGVNFLLTLMLGFVLTKSSPEMALVSSVVMLVLQVVIAAGYSGFFLAKYRATPGKMACGLVVVTPEGGEISVGRGVGRYFAEVLSSMILMAGYLMVLFDPEKRSLHDRICNTRVVYK